MFEATQKQEVSTEWEIAQLKKVVSADVRRLSSLSPLKMALNFIVGWGTVVGLAYLSSHFFNLWLYFLSVVVIAARQHGFVILMHEGVHNRLSKNIFFNDFLSDWFAAYPMIMKTSIYRRHHLPHHLNLNTKDDPDWVRKSPLPEWQFPMKKSNFREMYRKYFFGFGVYETFKLCQYLSGLNKANLTQRSSRKAAMGQILYYAFAIIILTKFHLWKDLLLFWLVPGLTVFPIIMRLRSIAEHFGVPMTNELNGTRNVLLPLWERILLVPLYASYHLDHHLFPAVPCYNLPRLNRVLSGQNFYKLHAHQNDSYLGRSQKSFLRDLFRD